MIYRSLWVVIRDSRIVLARPRLSYFFILVYCSNIPLRTISDLDSPLTSQQTSNFLRVSWSILTRSIKSFGFSETGRPFCATTLCPLSCCYTYYILFPQKSQYYFPKILPPLQSAAGGVWLKIRNRRTVESTRTRYNRFHHRLHIC